jgi:hypothetical protein
MIAILTGLALAAAKPPAGDADTNAWWATTAALSDDAMEGRDTGSAAYDRAAKLVAARFAKAGLKPAGEKGGWFQPVPMGEIAVSAAEISVAPLPQAGGGVRLRFLHDITVSPAPGMATAIDAGIAFRGYCDAGTLGEVRGKAVVCWGTHRAGHASEAERVAAVRAAGAAAYVVVADPGFTVEPPRWPYAYARAVWNEGSEPAAEPMLRLTLNADAVGKLLTGSGQDAAVIVQAGSAGAALPSFDVPSALHARFTLKRRSLVSANVIALLPGRDPAKRTQAIALTAHLDGYGYGEPVEGDGLYNGTLDDAAYVALLIRLAERRGGKGFARPVLFTVVTGEEKGLLGSRWFVDHPTVPIRDIAADINLDQLRPIFPLELLTVHGLDDSTLGDDVRVVAGGMGIAVQRDPEPERNLLRRTDHWPFMQKGVPATGFVFGYKPGTESERIYRHWYVSGYHRPQDDLAQPMDWKAAGDFNRFFYGLVERVADKDEAPAWKAGSALRPK